MDVSCGVPKTPAVKAASVCCGAAEGFHTKDGKTEGKQVPKHACFFSFFLKQAGLLEEKLNTKTKPSIPLQDRNFKCVVK